MDGESDYRAEPVLKTERTRKGLGRVPHPPLSGIGEEVNPPGLGPGDNSERYRDARPL
jgi:hypothetical protein